MIVKLCSRIPSRFVIILYSEKIVEDFERLGYNTVKTKPNNPFQTIILIRLRKGRVHVKCVCVYENVTLSMYLLCLIHFF